jgi:hypothetical protein
MDELPLSSRHWATKKDRWTRTARRTAVDEQLIREDPVNVEYRRDAAVYSRSLALVLIRIKHLDEAIKCGDRSQTLFEQLAKEDPANMEAQEALADSYWSEGYLLTRVHDPASALKHYDST